MFVGLPSAVAETCTTQSAMAPADRDRLVAAALALAQKMQADDITGLRALVVPEYDRDPGPMTNLVASVAPKLKDARFVRGSGLPAGCHGAAAGRRWQALRREFFCTLNQSPATVDFLIPGLAAGRYGFVIVRAESGKALWSLAFLLRQERNWSMVGFYPKPPDGGRAQRGLVLDPGARAGQARPALERLPLLPRGAGNCCNRVNFVSSTNLEQLRKEAEAATPPALSEGISPSVPLVVKAADGAEYRFTEFTTDDSRGGEQLDLAVHLEQEQPSESAAAAPPPKGKAASPPAGLAAHAQ